MSFYIEQTVANFEPIAAEIKTRKAALAGTEKSSLKYVKEQMVQIGIFQDALTIGK